ncbi:unnamed protein product, partial [Rotaria sp. Silwood1]
CWLSVNTLDGIYLMLVQTRSVVLESADEVVVLGGGIRSLARSSTFTFEKCSFADAVV